MLIKTMMLFKLTFLVLLITLIKMMHNLIYNGISYKYYKILRPSLYYGVLVEVYKIFFLFTLIQKLLNKRMIGLLHQIAMVPIHNHNILTLLLIQVLKLCLKNQFKMVMLGLLVPLVLLLLEVLDLLLKHIIETQD